MKPIYEHTQFGSVILFIMLIPVLGLVAAVAVSDAQPAALIPAVIVTVFILFTMVIFGSLTVKVSPEHVLLHFGPGWPRRSIPVEQISGVRVVRNAAWMGLGIHFIHRGMIYNVSGLDGVEISLNNGRLVRIGTDEPAALARAVEAVMKIDLEKK